MIWSGPSQSREARPVEIPKVSPRLRRCCRNGRLLRAQLINLQKKNETTFLSRRDYRESVSTGISTRRFFYRAAFGAPSAPLEERDRERRSHVSSFLGRGSRLAA